MSRTVFKNASGLPDREQITTARDLTILARAVQERFPKYYKYFQTRSFNFAGRVIGNHNRLLGRIEGVDGIKTGFTNASGFNLMTSARLDGRHVVGVVLGGRSGASRDNIMAKLIQTNLAKASTGGPRSSVLAEAGERRSAEPSRTRVASADVDTTAGTAPAASAGRPLDLNAMRPAPSSAETAAMRLPPPPPLPPAAVAFAPTAPSDIARTNPIPPPVSQKIEARLPATPAALPTPPEPPTRAEIAAARASDPVRTEAPRPEVSRTEPAVKRELAKPAAVSPWVIQIAAEENEGKARDLLDEAKSRSGRSLAGAAPFTEKVVRGTATLYRARFSGFSEADTAQEACRSLKRSGFACFATRS
jgi:D-alanyl-D-alanine carboxypeptidase